MIVYAGGGEYELDVPVEVRDHLCAHRRRSCDRCPRCFHGRHRCGFCFRTKSGLPPPLRRPKLRCAACGRFRPASTVVDLATGATIDLCPRCHTRGFEALTLF